MSNAVALATATQTFPNGNLDIIKPEILAFVDRYQAFLRKTAESILGLAETLVQAEADLNAVDFSIFCDNVGLVKGSPTYSKLKVIGQKSDRFRPFLGCLPNTWTTIYKLSKLEADQFARVSGALTPFITSKEIDEHIGGEKKSSTPQTFDFKIALGLIDVESKAEIYAVLLELKKRFKFALTEAPAVIDELKNIKLANAA